MELTIDEALQQGVAAQKEGKFQDAERLYRAILQAQPKHPNANHNLGVLFVSVGKPFDAIPFFKLALEANSQIEQFWLSYIEALIKVGWFDEAKRVLVEAAKSGVSPEKLEILHQQIQIPPPEDKKNKKQGLTLSEKRKRLAERKKSKQKKQRGKPSVAGPAQEEIDSLSSYYQSGQLAEFEELAIHMTKQFPADHIGWKALGIALKQAGRLSESIAPTQRSIELSPQDPENYSNLGVTLQELGRLEEAEASYRRAIALKTDYAEPHFNLAITLYELGRLEEA